jgi:hypothetical protein
VVTPVFRKPLLVRLLARLRYLEALVDAHDAELMILKAHAGLIEPDCPPPAGKEQAHADHEPARR